MRQAFRFVRRLGATLAVLAVAVSGSGSGTIAAPRRVLFVGNSLTYANDLPALLAALARAAGQPGLEVAAVVRGGWGLEDHWHDGTARERIREGGWDVVVLQQGPSSLPDSRADLVRWTRKFGDEIRKAGARPALYMVWPESSRSEAFAQVSASYRAAADAADGLILPAGDAWRAAWRRMPAAPLYGPDGFHPSAAGSYLAAVTMYACLYGASPVGLPASVELSKGTLTLPPDLARALQEAAAEVAEP